MQLNEQKTQRAAPSPSISSPTSWQGAVSKPLGTLWWHAADQHGDRKFPAALGQHHPLMASILVLSAGPVLLRSHSCCVLWKWLQERAHLWAQKFSEAQPTGSSTRARRSCLCPLVTLQTALSNHSSMDRPQPQGFIPRAGRRAGAAAQPVLPHRARRHHSSAILPRSHQQSLKLHPCSSHPKTTPRVMLHSPKHGTCPVPSLPQSGSGNAGGQPAASMSLSMHCRFLCRLVAVTSSPAVTTLCEAVTVQGCGRGQSGGPVTDAPSGQSWCGSPAVHFTSKVQTSTAVAPL